MTHPRVSFIVPCYKLGHLLRECVDSILGQTFHALEVLIMDDCSPDDTPRVAQSYTDPRVRYIRNPQNIGCNANYNKGIGLSQGEFVWLISADDRLRSRHVVERYVRTLEAHPEAGFVFCPVVGLEASGETRVLPYWSHGPRDAVFPGRAFLQRLAACNCVSAPSGMVRRECYDRLGRFPDLPFAGDWYMWCLFALHYDVAYLAEPMVNYRLHPANQTKILQSRDYRILIHDDLVVLWSTQAAAADKGWSEVVRAFRESLADYYFRQIAYARPGMTPQDFEASLEKYATTGEEAREVRWRVKASLGNHAYQQGDLPRALAYYREALAGSPASPDLWARYLLVRLGQPGIRVRRRVAELRDAWFRRAAAVPDGGAEGSGGR
jgi:glycosyltransferase involved in cell wall biosynthesis